MFTSFMYSLRSRLEAALEANFGKTIQYNPSTEEYDIKQYKGYKRQIHQRYSSFNGLSMLLNPHLANFKFDPILQKISEAKEWLEKNKGSCHKRKMAYLNGLNALVEDFNKDDKNYQDAVKSFVKILNSMENLTKYKELQPSIQMLRILLTENDGFFKKLFNTEIAIELAKKEKDNFFCGVLPHSKLVKDFFTATKPDDEHFWSDDDKMKVYFSNLPTLGRLIATIATEILSKEQNQSALERILGSCSTREVSRPRLSVDTLMAEELSHHLYRQWNFFERCGYKNESLDDLDLKYDEQNRNEDTSSQPNSSQSDSEEVDEVKMCINEVLRDQISYDKNEDPPIIFFSDGPTTSTDINDSHM